MGSFPPNMFEAQGFTLLRSRKAPMKKPSERKADAPLGYRLNGHIALSASTLPGGAGWLGRQPNS